MSARRWFWSPAKLHWPFCRRKIVSHLFAIWPQRSDLSAVFNALSHAPRASRHFVTFFGMIPNFEPRANFAETCGAGPAKGFPAVQREPRAGQQLRRGIKKILPQYDNGSTRDWLMTFLLDLGMERRDGELRFAIEDGRFGLKRVVARFHFIRPRRIEIEDETFSFNAGDTIQLFFSYRYTPERVQKILARYSLKVCEQWIAKSGEEGVFLCNVAASRRLIPQPAALSAAQNAFIVSSTALDARDFVGAKQIGFAQRGQHGEERLGTTDFVAEKFKGVGQGMADRKTQRAQPERIQKYVHLVPHPDGAVLQIAVVKAQAGIEQDFLHAVALRDFNLARKILAHPFNRDRRSNQNRRLRGRFCPARNR